MNIESNTKKQRLTPKQALNKAFLRKKPLRNDIDLFRSNLKKLLSKISEIEREENQKNHLRDFLRDTFYHETNEINTKETIDLVIHLGNSNIDNVGVIIEAKRPSNKNEMIVKEELNKKALQELLLYYLRERITGNNLEIKNLIATNINEWYIFDAILFEKYFACNKDLVRMFNDFEEGRLAGKDTNFFYNNIASPAIEKVKREISYVYFNIQDYHDAINYQNDDKALIALYKILSPEHLLKLPFANDSNSLNKNFYTELLHIIGLEEIKDGSKSLIQRKNEFGRNSGSLLESTIFQLEDVISEGIIFEEALGLVITWINHILFLKLLESQQLKYQKGNQDYSFLNKNKIKGYDDLNNLFFRVLAVHPENRHSQVKDNYKNVPFLNSSLFEKIDAENTFFPISQLSDSTIPIHNGTVLKDNRGVKRKGEINTLEYLFEFLNAYDFSSEGEEEIQENNKTLINASVLGLIFEKINGYKDGSFFTPGFITMFMCKETIRKAVVRRFNEVKKWNCEDINDVHNKITDLKEANEIMNGLHICDPAVGSGHYLVSALNELLSIKSELGILMDSHGKRLRDYTIVVENDEIILIDEDGNLFCYNPSNAESRRVQEVLFAEKQKLIENCLFGVDINPNAVKICRLRLWIELLKNSFYTEESNYLHLETLPNIDINIKCGNSLVSRFDTNIDIKQELKKLKYSVKQYKESVFKYKNANSKTEKKEMETLINEIKSNFQVEVENNDKRLLAKKRLMIELVNLSQGELFGLSRKEIELREKRISEISEKLKAIEIEIEEIRNNVLFENAFEWRFEFPEVLNDDGAFIGFDVVIRNPPYHQLSKDKNASERYINYLKERFSTSGGRANTFIFFIHFGLNILSDHGFYSFIVPNTLLTQEYYKDTRKYLLDQAYLSKIISYVDLPFENAVVENITFIVEKLQISDYFIEHYVDSFEDIMLTAEK